MGTKAVRYIAIIITTAFFISGCGFIYEKQVNDAYSKLIIGMTKSELDNAFKGVKFLKEQVIVKYPGSSESSMRISLKENKYYKDIYPSDIFKKVTFDGNAKVISYLIRKELNWPNGWLLDYIVIFYDKKSDMIIGWGKIKTYGETNTWRDIF